MGCGSDISFTLHSLIPAAFGLFYGNHVEALTGTNEDPADPDAVSRACYFAAVIYAAFIAFCGLQVSRFVIRRCVQS